MKGSEGAGILPFLSKKARASSSLCNVDGVDMAVCGRGLSVAIGLFEITRMHAVWTRLDRKRESRDQTSAWHPRSGGMGNPR